MNANKDIHGEYSAKRDKELPEKGGDCNSAGERQIPKGYPARDRQSSTGGKGRARK